MIGYDYHPKSNQDPEKAKNHNPDPNPKQQPDYPVFKTRIRLRCTPLFCRPTRLALSLFFRLFTAVL